MSIPHDPIHHEDCYCVTDRLRALVRKHGQDKAMLALRDAGDTVPGGFDPEDIHAVIDEAEWILDPHLPCEVN